MHRLSVALQYYVHVRLNNDPGWKDIEVGVGQQGLLGASLRAQRQRAGWAAGMGSCRRGATLSRRAGPEALSRGRPRRPRRRLRRLAPRRLPRRSSCPTATCPARASTRRWPSSASSAAALGGTPTRGTACTASTLTSSCWRWPPTSPTLPSCARWGCQGGWGPQRSGGGDWADWAAGAPEAVYGPRAGLTAASRGPPPPPPPGRVPARRRRRRRPRPQQAAHPVAGAGGGGAEARDRGWHS
jgi:hypothetical protein